MPPSSTPTSAFEPRNAFISHAHADNAICTPYATGLNQRGLDIWYDLNNNPEGQMLAKTLQRELQARMALVVFVTPAALESFWVDLEIDAYLGLMAQDHARMLLPVRLKPCQMPPFMNATTWIDGVGLPVAEVVERIARALNDPVERLHSVAPAPSPHASPQQTELFQRLASETHDELLASHWNDAISKATFALRLPGATPTASLYGDLALAYASVERWQESLDAARQGRGLDISRADIWQTEARALTLLAHQARASLPGAQKTTAETVARYDAEALTALDSARALIPARDLPARLALLADLRAAHLGAERWADALATVNDELALAPGAPTRLTAKLELLRRLGLASEALAVARTLAARPEVAAADWLVVAQLCPATAHDEAAQALLRAEALAPEGARLAPQLRAVLFPPPDVPQRLASLGFRGVNIAGTQAILPPLVGVAACPFLMGSDPARDSAAKESWAKDELPQHRIELAAFEIGKYPVTVAEYQLFLTATRHAAPTSPINNLTWEQQTRDRLDHPVVNVSWREAMAYVAWLREVTSQPGWRLPSETQWEKAARWDAAQGVSRIYPWGDSFDKQRCNTVESGIKTTTPVGSYPANDRQRSGASPCGAEDMAGNVWEWTSSLFKPYPYTESDGREAQNSTENRTLRGGAWIDVPRNARAACRVHVRPGNLYVSIGFRLVRVPGSFH